MPSLSEDSVFHGSIRIKQSKKGYRFTEDAVLIAAFSAKTLHSVPLAADFGAGCGIIGLILLHRGVAEKVVAVEIQPSLSSLVMVNAEINGRSTDLINLCADFRTVPLQSQSLELIVCNPPYRPLGQGHLPSHQERAVARHEMTSSPFSIAEESRRCLTPEGRLVLVYPSNRFEEVRSSLGKNGLSIVRKRSVSPKPSETPLVDLLEARPIESVKTQKMIIEPTLVVRDEQGNRTEEMTKILSGIF